MYETPVFNENNEKILCEMGGKNAEMLMTIKVKQLSAGESFTAQIHTTCGPTWTATTATGWRCMRA